MKEHFRNQEDRDEYAAKLACIYEQQRSVIGVAKELGVSPMTVCRHMDAYGIPRSVADRKARAFYAGLDTNAIVSAYESDEPIKVILARFGISYFMLQSIVKKANCTPRYKKGIKA